MVYTVTERLRPAVLANIGNKFRADGVVAACNHCIDDLILNRITVDCESPDEVVQAITELVESMVEVVDELP